MPWRSKLIHTLSRCPRDFLIPDLKDGIRNSSLFKLVSPPAVLAIFNRLTERLSATFSFSPIFISCRISCALVRFPHWRTSLFISSSRSDSLVCSAAIIYRLAPTRWRMEYRVMCPTTLGAATPTTSDTIARIMRPCCDSLGTFILSNGIEKVRPVSSSVP